MIGQLSLKLVEKHKVNPNLAPALLNKALVERYDNAFDYSVEDQAKITAYLSTITQYLDKVKTAYTWKFTTIPKDVPAIPDELRVIFSSQPPLPPLQVLEPVST
jgi:hypothetical protein